MLLLLYAQQFDQKVHLLSLLCCYSVCTGVNCHFCEIKLMMRLTAVEKGHVYAGTGVTFARKGRNGSSKCLCARLGYRIVTFWNASPEHAVTAV